MLPRPRRRVRGRRRGELLLSPVAAGGREPGPETASPPGTPSLRPLAEDVWVVERPFRVLGLRLGTRMTVVRLPGGGLWLHSPVAPDARLREELAREGPVRHVVAPNRVHHLYVAAAREAWPEATFHAAPGLARKRPKLSFDAELSDAAPDAWGGAIRTRVVRGAPYLSEVACLHVPSRTLVLTDLCFNFTECPHTPTRWWLRAMGGLGGLRCTRQVRWLLRDREALRESLEAVLAWDPVRIVVAHGNVLPASGRRVLRETFAWL